MNSFEKPPGAEELGNIEQEGELSEVLEAEKIVSVEAGIEKTFGIKKKDLESIPGFGEISAGQRSIVLENFKELTLKAVEEKAVEASREETAKAGFWGRMWHGAFRQYYSAKAEKSSAENILGGGIEIHREALSELVRQIRESGMDAEWDAKEGKFKILYAAQLENLDMKEREDFEKFNRVAEKFAAMPPEWRYSKSEKKKFDKLEKEYKEYLGKIGEIAKRKELSGGESEQIAEFNAVKYVATVDKKARFSQFFLSNPDAGRELEKIESQPVWAKALSNALLERGGYMAMGAAARTVTTSFLGLAGAPLAAAGMGGWIARKRVIGTLREEAKLAEAGKKHSELITSVKAENLEDRIDSLLAEFNGEDSEAEKGKIISRLDMRLDYTRFKMEGGLVQYGEGAEKIKRQYSLLQKLSEAELIVRSHEGAKTKGVSEAQEKTEERLERFLNFKERKVEKHVRNQTIKGAVLAAGFSILGYAIRDYFSGGAVREKIGEEVGHAAEKLSEMKTKSMDYLAGVVCKDIESDNLFNELVRRGVSFEGARPDTVKSLMENGVSKESLSAAGVKPDVISEAASGAAGKPEIPLGGISEQLKLATIGKGEGIEHALIRQLKADPSRFGFKGDMDDISEVGKWAGAKAHRIAIENNYVDPKTGMEIRVKEMGVGGNPAYILEKNASGGIKVTEYIGGEKTGGEGTVNAYEYEWKKPEGHAAPKAGGLPAEEIKERPKIPTVKAEGYEEGVKAEEAAKIHEADHRAHVGETVKPKETPAGTAGKEVAPPVAAKAVKIEGGEIEFKYDASGNPVEVGKGLYDLKLTGVTGKEYLAENFREKAMDWAKKQGGNPDFQMTGIRLTSFGQKMSILMNAYDKLTRGGHQREAGFILKSMKNEIAGIEKSYGNEIIDYSKLPDYLKK